MHRGLMLLVVAAYLLCAQISAAFAGGGYPDPEAGGFDAPLAPEQAGSGCGWDYACPPRPDFGRRTIIAGVPGAQVNIKNNYGVVKIYPGKGRYPLGKFAPDCPGPSCAGGSAGGVIEGGIMEGGEIETGLNDGPGPRGGVSCGGYPCTEDCGISCWIARFKAGYCGHGCDFYREHVRFVPAQTVITVPRPIYYRDPPFRNFQGSGEYYRDPRFGNFQGRGGYKPSIADWRGGDGPGPNRGGYIKKQPYARPKASVPPVEDYNNRYDPPFSPKCGSRSDC